MAISNKYKDILDDLVDSLYIELPNQPDLLNQPELIDKRLHNAPRSKSGSPILLKEDYLDEDVLVTLLDLAPNI